MERDTITREGRLIKHARGRLGGRDRARERDEVMGRPLNRNAAAQ